MEKGIENLRDYCFNQFGLEFADGYVVTALGVKTDGFKRWFPLRNFGHHQGDARLFKEVDAPSLSQNDIIMLARNYDHKRPVKRMNSRRFIVEKL